MADYTTNYNLKKPALDDYADILVTIVFYHIISGNYMVKTVKERCLKFQK